MAGLHRLVLHHLVIVLPHRRVPLHQVTLQHVDLFQDGPEVEVAVVGPVAPNEGRSLLLHEALELAEAVPHHFHSLVPALVVLGPSVGEAAGCGLQF